MIKDRNLTPGTKLTGRYHKEEHTCEVTSGEVGKLKYRLQDGREFKSPSAAGMAITGHACDGWTFWSLAAAVDSKPAEIVPEAVVSAETPTPEQVHEQTWTTVVISTEEKPSEAKKTGTYKMRNQKGAPKGQARWFCYDCAEPFNAPSTEKHAVCPNKHSAK